VDHPVHASVLCVLRDMHAGWMNKEGRSSEERVRSSPDYAGRAVEWRRVLEAWRTGGKFVALRLTPTNFNQSGSAGR
jgi:hypothetical protein